MLCDRGQLFERDGKTPVYVSNALSCIICLSC